MDLLNEPDQEQRIDALRRELQKLCGDTPAAMATPRLDMLPAANDTILLRNTGSSMCEYRPASR